MEQVKALYQILLPLTDNSGESLSAEVNEIMDEIMRTFGGLTRLPNVQGTWSNGKQVYTDTLVPVQFATRDSAEVDRIAKLAKETLRQEAVMVSEIGTAKFY